MTYPGYTGANALRGTVIYAAGDTVAAVLLGEFSLPRMLGMMLVGGTVYALEIPNWFHWVDRHVPPREEVLCTLQRTALAQLYFNPLWIARHLLIIELFSGRWQNIGWGLLGLGLWSFMANIPITLMANYLIQNKLPYDWRFFTSALFSSLMAIYYALSEVLFGG